MSFWLLCEGKDSKEGKIEIKRVIREAMSVVKVEKRMEISLGSSRNGKKIIE